MKEYKEILNNKKEKLFVTLLARTKFQNCVQLHTDLLKSLIFKRWSRPVFVPAKALVSVLS